MTHAAFTLTLLFALAPVAAAEQQPPADQAQSRATQAPIATYLRRAYAAVATDVLKAVEMMPDDAFAFRPAGVDEKVRTFGAIVHHIVSVNSWVCSMGAGKPDPITALGPKPIVEKARLVTLLTETHARCTAYLETLTDGNLADVLATTSASRELQAVRGNAVIFAIAHSNEHYGNLVTYLRAKGLVPPATPSQAFFLSPVKSGGDR